MKPFLTVGVLLLAMSVIVSLFGSSDPVAIDNFRDFTIIPVHTRSGVNAFITLGLPTGPPFGPPRTTNNSTIYSNGTYRIEVSEAAHQARNLIRVRVERTDGQIFPLGSFGVLVRAPRAAIGGIWYPSAEVASKNIMAADANTPIHGIADANFGIPYVGAAGPDSKTVIAVGLGRQDASVTISGRPTQTGLYEFRLSAATSRTARAFDESFYISTDGAATWFETAANYADWVDGLMNYQPFPISDSAYDPVYDTWYWSGDRVDQSLYLSTAELASDIGARLYLADAGWDAPSGEYDKWLAGRTGDYTPTTDKFSDLSATFDAIRQESGLGVQLWLQPFAVGRASARYAQTRNMHIHLPMNRSNLPGWFGLDYAPFVLPAGQTLETVNLCPRLSATPAYLRDLFNEMAAHYQPEGYWLDFMDGVSTACTASHTHNFATFGEGFRESLSAIKETILANNPQAVVHFRARYANLNNKSFSNVWQSEDSPGDFDRMRLNALQLRPFSKGVVFASDQLYWETTESEATVSRFIMTSVMTGVPSFGVNLLDAPQWTMMMLREWLKFYQTHKQELTRGKVVPFGSLNMPNHKIEGQSNTFVYLRNLSGNGLAANTTNIFIMNATDSDRISARLHPPAGITAYSAVIANRYLAPSRRPIRLNVSPNGLVYLNLVVEQGGMVSLTPIQ